MCKIGDIIVVRNSKVGNNQIGQHSFIILSTAHGEIEGVPFDLVCNLMSSLEGKGEEYKKRKLSYPENMPYSSKEENVINGHNKEGFIKAGVYFLFKREDLDYRVIGNIETELYIRLMNYINNMNPEDIKIIKDNLKGKD